MNREESERVLNFAMSIGERMLMNGAEVARVEESIQRICAAYGAVRVDVFSITSSVIATLFFDEEQSCTQSRRIRSWRSDMDALDRLNDLSRRVCRRLLSDEEIRGELKRIDAGRQYSFLVQVLTYALVSGAFSVFFGGDVWDMLSSACIGIALRCIDPLIRRISANRLVFGLISAVFGGLLSNLAVRLGVGHHADLISIGNIMLFIPGVAFTTSLRDMFLGDIVTGLIRFFESLLLAIVIALGFTLANFLF